MSHGLHMSMMIADIVILEARKKGATYVSEIEIDLGKLACFSIKQIETYLMMRLENSVAEGAEVIINRIDPEAHCHDCSFEGKLLKISQDIDRIEFYEPLCPNCKSNSITITKGKDCKLRSLKIINS